MPSFKINVTAFSWSSMQYAEDMQTDKKLFSVSRITGFAWRSDYAVCLGDGSKWVGPTSIHMNSHVSAMHGQAVLCRHEGSELSLC